MKIEIGARVRTRDGRQVGEVHRVLVDLDDDNSVTGIVVLKGHLLGRAKLLADAPEAALAELIQLAPRMSRAELALHVADSARRQRRDHGRSV